MKINYVAPIDELSGYGEFARNVVSGLIAIGADVKIQPLKINQDGGQATQFKDLLGKHVKPDVSIINTVPTLAQQFISSNATNVLYTMWEADKLPNTWIESCNKFDLILVPSKHNLQVFRDAAKPTVELAQPAIDFTQLNGRVRPVRKTSAQTPFIFYSIFQWTERKNPIGLIRAYWAAFTGRDDVILRLKLYARGNNSGELVRVNAEIVALKQSVRLRHYPKIELVADSMSREEIIQFHLAGDCFVTASRGEGLGLGLIEAMALETTCIATQSSGHLDFTIDYPLDRNCYVVPVMNFPCSGMVNYAPFYEGDMFWSEADLGKLGEAMKFALLGNQPMEVLNGHSSNLFIQKQASKNVRSLYDFKACSQQLLIILEAHIKKS